MSSLIIFGYIPGSSVQLLNIINIGVFKNGSCSIIIIIYYIITALKYLILVVSDNVILITYRMIIGIFNILYILFNS